MGSDRVLTQHRHLERFGDVDSCGLAVTMIVMIVMIVMIGKEGRSEGMKVVAWLEVKSGLRLKSRGQGEGEGQSQTHTPVGTAEVYCIATRLLLSLRPCPRCP